LAEAISAVQESQALLQAIDLRTCGRELRTNVKRSREAATTLLETLQDALAADEPAPPRLTVAAGTS
jgi:hypothetical protein